MMKASVIASIEAAQDALGDIMVAFRKATSNADLKYTSVDFEVILLTAHKGLLSTSAPNEHNADVRANLSRAMASIAKSRTWQRRQAEKGDGSFVYAEIIYAYQCQAMAELAIAKALSEFIEV